MPEVLAEIVEQLRARDPEERPASAEEVIDLLQPFAVAPVARKPCEWDGKRKAAVVLEVLRGKSTAAAVCAPAFCHSSLALRNFKGARCDEPNKSRQS